MKKQLIGLVALAMVFCMAPQAHAWDIEFALGGWHQEIGGTLGYGDDIVSADIIDLDDDLDFDKETEVYGRARLDLPLILPNINVVLAPMSFEGDGDVSVDVDYGDITIPANADVDLDLTLDQYDVALFWGIPFLKTATAGILNVDWGLNVRWVDFEAKVSYDAGLAGSGDEKADFSGPIPMLFLACQVMPTDSFGIEVEGRGLSIGDNKLWSIIGRVRFNFTGPVFVAGGYRFDDLEIDEDDVEADIEFSGPFFELGLQF